MFSFALYTLLSRYSYWLYSRRIQLFLLQARAHLKDKKEWWLRNIFLAVDSAEFLRDQVGPRSLVGAYSDKKPAKKEFIG